MLSSTVKSQINSKLKNIYSKNFNNRDLKIFSDEIFELQDKPIVSMYDDSEKFSFLVA